MQSLISCVALALASALSLSCGKAEQAPPTGAAPAVLAPRELALKITAALTAGDGPAMGALLPRQNAEVLIEVRQALAETDERTSETVKSASEMETWLGKTRPGWTCAGRACTWPGGLRTGGLERCLGDCCFSDWPGGIDTGALHLRRVCFAAREGGEPRLSYIGFVEAK